MTIVYLLTLFLLIANSSCSIIQVYDVVVVGSGPGASPLFYRIAKEFPHLKLLMLESGYNEIGRTVATEPRVWTASNAAAYGFDSSVKKIMTQEVPTPKNEYVPRLFGGGTAVNAQLWVRASRQDMDNWNVPGWTYDEFAPFMNLVENFTETSTNRGNNGLITIQKMPITANHTTVFRDAMMSTFNLSFIDDHNAGDLRGVSGLQRNSKSANINAPTREYAGNTYLSQPEIVNNPKVKIEYGSTAVKIIFDEKRSGKLKAIAVEYVKEGDKRIAIARKKIVLSAGVFGTPRLLQLSGIGDPNDLAFANIETLLNLTQVGKNIAEEAGAVLSFRGPTFPEDDGSIVTGFGNTGLDGAPSNNVDYEIFGKLYQIPNLYTTLSVNLVLLRTDSKGVVRVRDRDPFSDPYFTLGLMTSSTPNQYARLRWLFRKARQWVSEANLGFVEMSPGYQTMPLDASDAVLDSWLTTSWAPYVHSTGSCRIGTSAENGVVDANLNVFGTDLMISDASIIPSKLSAHPMATIYGISEKAFDILKNEL